MFTMIRAKCRKNVFGDFNKLLQYITYCVKIMSLLYDFNCWKAMISLGKQAKCTILYRGIQTFDVFKN